MTADDVSAGAIISLMPQALAQSTCEFERHEPKSCLATTEFPYPTVSREDRYALQIKKFETEDSKELLLLYKLQGTKLWLVPHQSLIK